MAYISKQLPEDQQNLYGRNEQTSTPIPPTSGSAGTGSSGGGAAPGVGTPTQFGSSAAKLSDYLKANQSQIQQFGQQVAGDLTNRYNQSRSDIQKGADDFQTQVQQGYTPPTQEQLGQAFQNPTEFAKNSENVNKFQSWYNPTYSGPQSFEGSSIYSNLNNQVNKAVENAGLVNTLPGLGTYFQNMMGTTNTTPGMQTLDAALLQRNPEARQNIQKAAEPYKNLTSYLNESTQGANKAIEAKKAETAKSGEDVRAQTEGVTNQLTQDLQSRLNQARAGGLQNQSAFLQALQQGAGLTPEEMKQYNIKNWDDILNYRNIIKNTAGPFGDTQAKYGENFDLTPYFTPGNAETAYTMENVASPEDYAREAALQQLTGDRFNLLPNGGELAGTAPGALGQYNSGQALQDVRNKLLGLDTSVINQYSGINLGAHPEWGANNIAGTYEPGWRDILKDPQQALSYQSMVDIFNRNPNLTNDTQKNVANTLQQWLADSGALPPSGGGGDAFTPTTPGSQNIRVVDGQMQYWTGSEWTDKPAEYIYKDADGNQTGPDAGAQPYKFNFETGEYEPYGDPITSGGNQPGIIGGFNPGGPM